MLLCHFAFSISRFAFCRSALCFFEFSTDAVGVADGGDFGPMVGDATKWVDEEGAADDAMVRLAGGEFAGEGSVVLMSNAKILIAEQADFQVVLSTKQAVTGGGVGADAEDVGVELVEACEQAGEVVGLTLAAGRVILGVEIKHEPAATVVRERDGFVVVIKQGEIRCWFTGPGGGCSGGRFHVVRTRVGEVGGGTGGEEQAANQT